MDIDKGDPAMGGPGRKFFDILEEVKRKRRQQYRTAVTLTKKLRKKKKDRLRS